MPCYKVSSVQCKLYNRPSTTQVLLENTPNCAATLRLLTFSIAYTFSLIGYELYSINLQISTCSSCVIFINDFRVIVSWKYTQYVNNMYKRNFYEVSVLSWRNPRYGPFWYTLKILGFPCSEEVYT